MKKLLFILLILVSFYGQGQNWLTDFEQAKKTAAQKMVEEAAEVVSGSVLS